MEMILVYILGKLETGKELTVPEAIAKAEQVERVSLTYGIYDFCVEAKFQTMEELDGFLFNVVRKTPGVKDTYTLVTSKIFSKD